MWAVPVVTAIIPGRLPIASAAFVTRFTTIWRTWAASARTGGSAGARSKRRLQCRLIEMGFRQGGPAGFGLRRVLIDQAGQVKGELKRGEHKSLQTDRVILMPGPDSEVAAVIRFDPARFPPESE